MEMTEGLCGVGPDFSGDKHAERGFRTQADREQLQTMWRAVELKEGGSTCRGDCGLRRNIVLRL